MQDTENKSITSSVKKGIYLIIGTLALGAGIIGVFLPVIPTTPLILLSAWCFFRSNSKIYQWVISNEKFGPTIENFQEGNGVTVKTKIRAVVMMWLTISVSVYIFIRNIYLIGFLYLMAVSVSIYLYKLPTLNE
jgi:uncharacterized membrane protein YbaN (DUF454 family)